MRSPRLSSDLNAWAVTQCQVQQEKVGTVQRQKAGYFFSAICLGDHSEVSG